MLNSVLIRRSWSRSSSLHPPAVSGRSPGRPPGPAGLLRQRRLRAPSARSPPSLLLLLLLSAISAVCRCYCCCCSVGNSPLIRDSCHHLLSRWWLLRRRVCVGSHFQASSVLSSCYVVALWLRSIGKFQILGSVTCMVVPLHQPSLFQFSMLSGKLWLE